MARLQKSCTKTNFAEPASNGLRRSSRPSSAALLESRLESWHAFRITVANRIITLYNSEISGGKGISRHQLEPGLKSATAISRHRGPRQKCRQASPFDAGHSDFVVILKSTRQ